jgi:hypothetical protein
MKNLQLRHLEHRARWTPRILAAHIVARFEGENSFLYLCRDVHGICRQDMMMIDSKFSIRKAKVRFRRINQCLLAKTEHNAASVAMAANICFRGKALARSAWRSF